MKELKFRQLITNEDDGTVQFHYWGYLHTCSVGLPVFINPLGAVEWDLRTSDQYTGLKDKNGAEIYENDIVINTHVGRERYTPEQLADAVVKIDMGENWPVILNEDNREIIGNIHTHPDLLTDE